MIDGLLRVRKVSLHVRQQIIGIFFKHRGNEVYHLGQASDKLSITLELPRKEIKCLLSCTTKASDVLSTPLQVITKGNEVLRPGRQRQFVDCVIDVPPSLSELLAYGAAAQLAQRHHRKRHHFHEC